MFNLRANAARHLRPITKYVNPSSSRAMYYTDSRYVFEDKVTYSHIAMLLIILSGKL